MINRNIEACDLLWKAYEHELAHEVIDNLKNYSISLFETIANRGGVELSEVMHDKRYSDSDTIKYYSYNNRLKYALCAATISRSFYRGDDYNRALYTYLNDQCRQKELNIIRDDVCKIAKGENIIFNKNYTLTSIYRMPDLRYTEPENNGQITFKVITDGFSSVDTNLIFSKENKKFLVSLCKFIDSIPAPFNMAYLKELKNKFPSALYCDEMRISNATRITTIIYKKEFFPATGSTVKTLIFD